MTGGGLENTIFTIPALYLKHIVLKGSQSSATRINCAECAQTNWMAQVTRNPAHLQRFQCKTWLSQGNSDKAATHHTELHRGGKKQTPVNFQQPAPVNSQLPLPVVPQPLAQPPNAVPVSVGQVMRPVWNYQQSWPNVQPQQMSASYFNHPPQMQLSGNRP